MAYGVYGSSRKNKMAHEEIESLAATFAHEAADRFFAKHPELKRPAVKATAPAQPTRSSPPRRCDNDRHRAAADHRAGGADRAVNRNPANKAVQNRTSRTVVPRQRCVLLRHYLAPASPAGVLFGSPR